MVQVDSQMYIRIFHHFLSYFSNSQIWLNQLMDDHLKIKIKEIINMLLNMVVFKNCGLLITFEVSIHSFPQKNTMKKIK